MDILKPNLYLQSCAVQYWVHSNIKKNSKNNLNSLWIHDITLLEEGEFTMTSDRQVTTIRLPNNLNQHLQQYADKQGLSKNYIMVKALKQFVERNEK